MMILPVSMKKEMESGNPFFIELYTIRLRTSVLRLCAADEDIVYNENKYFAVPIQREDIERSIDSIVNDCTLQIADGGDTDEMLAYALNGYDFRGCKCEIIRIQYPKSLEDPSCVSFVFAGEIDEPSFADGVFSCKVSREFPQIQVPNRDYRLFCNSEFGDAECGMSLGKETVMVAKKSPNVLRLPKSYAKNYWLYGTISMEGESRTIIKSEGDLITLNLNFLQDFTTRTATLKRGCDKSAAMCKKYGNMKHFSGFPAIPFENVYR